MDIEVPFSRFYADELRAAFDRSGRPDEEFLSRCASVPGTNAKYYARMAANDANTLARIEGARDIEDCAFGHPKIKSHYVRYYSYTAYNLHFMEVHARSHERLREHPELIDQAEDMVAEVIRQACDEVASLIAKAEVVMTDNGVNHSVRYGGGPLLVPAEVVSPHCATYLALLMQADRLLGLLEYERLRGYITNGACDREFARVDRLLKAVQRTALRLASGLRRRLNPGGPAVADPPSDPSGAKTLSETSLFAEPSTPDLAVVAK